MALENFLIGYGLEPDQAAKVMAIVNELRDLNIKVRELDDEPNN